jgi:hypothetical protein
METVIHGHSNSQKALAAAELQQLQRRMAFEDFAGEILLGFKPRGANTTPTAQGNSAVTPQPSTGQGSINTGSNLGHNISNVGSLQNLANYGPNLNVGPVQNPLDLSGLINPKTIGGAAGLIAGGTSMVRPGAWLGDKIGEWLTDMSPEPNRPDATDGSSTNMIEPDRPDTTQGDIPHNRTPGQIAAGRAAETAQYGSHFLNAALNDYNSNFRLAVEGLHPNASATPEWAQARIRQDAAFDMFANGLLARGYALHDVQEARKYFMTNNDLPEWVKPLAGEIRDEYLAELKAKKGIA